LKSDRAAWRRLPIAGEVVGLVSDALAAEDRKDYPQHVEGLRLRESDGRLVRVQNLGNPEAPGLGYGPHTLRQLVQQVDPFDDAPRGFASALLYLSDQERARIMNERLAKTNPETEVTLRTRLPHSGDGRIARAALSRIYGSVTDHDIAGALGEVLSGDGTGRLDYKPGDQKSRFEVIWPSEIPVETFVVGDVHYACLSITNSETGEGSLRIAPAVVRARCANLTLSVGEGTEVTIRHIGDEDALLHRLKKAIRSAVDDLEPLLAVISASARIPLGEAWTVKKALEAIGRKYRLPGDAPRLWIAQHEASAYPETVWGLSAAISESAHKRDTWGDAAEWERVGSEVQALAVKVARGGASMGAVFAKALELEVVGAN